jgi:HSP20 family protein
MKDGENNVFKQMDVIASEMENLFYHLFSPKSPVKTVCQHHWSPMADVYETADKLIVKMDLAGVKRDDLGISLDDNRLIIRGVRHEKTPDGVTAYHQMEINYGSFERVLHLRPGVRKKDISAQFEDGFLTISITKQPPSKEESVGIEVE